MKFLKEDYPAVYIKFCKEHDLMQELSYYIGECIELKSVGPIKYAQYIHGGVLPMLEQ